MCLESRTDVVPEQAPPCEDRTPVVAESPVRDLSAALAVCGLLLLTVVMLFCRTVNFGFVNFDDNLYVYDNPQVKSGLTAEGIVWAFTTNCARNWHPLTWLSHMLDCQFYGLESGGHHWTSVLLHAAAAILLFLVLWRMTGDLWPSAFVAALFAIHPLRVESVAWVAERKDVLSGLFFMLTLGAYVGYVHRPFSLFRYLTVVALFALGLMAKPMLVTLPLVLLLLDYWPLGRFAKPWRLVVEKLPMLALSAAACVATRLAQSEAVKSIEDISLTSRVENALVSYVSYLGNFFYPAGLAAFYPHPGDRLPLWQVAGALLLLVCISVGVLACRRRCPYLLVGWLWYLGMLVPVIGLVQVGHQAMADRYTYLPQIGLAMALVWGANRAIVSWPHRAWLCGVASALAMAALMGCTWRQTSYWRDSETLWNHTLACTSRNALAHFNLGGALYKQGRVAEAIVHFREVLAITPGQAVVHGDLGIALADQKKYDEAMAEYHKALQIKPDYVDVYNNLGVALYDQGRVAEAIAQYRKALDIDPRYARAHYNLGNALSADSQFDEAIAEYQQTLKIRSDYSAARDKLGLLLYQRGRIPEAIAQFDQAVRSEPENRLALNRMARGLATSPEASVRNGPQAVELAQRAANLPGGRVPMILDTLAAAYAESGRFSEAVQTAERALALASRQNNAALADVLRDRIKLYQSGSPYRETPQFISPPFGLP